MLTLFSPAALWSLAALLLPLALHLWRQPPRTVQLPSLRFLQVHAGRRLHDLRWRERLLLAARLGLFALLACLIARPHWRHAPRMAHHWVLLDPNAVLDAHALARLRPLQTAGVEMHLLVPGLPTDPPSPVGRDADAPDLWSLLREADALLPAGSTLTIFSPARLSSLRGLRPTLRSKSEWINTSDRVSDIPYAWVESIQSASTPGQPPPAVFGVSDASTVRFTTAPPAGWKLETRPGAARLLASTGQNVPWTVAASPTPLSVLILHEAARTEDARYLAAAIRTAAQPTNRLLDLHVVHTTADFSTLPATDWTCWLAAAPPMSIENRQTALLQDAPLADSVSPDWIVPQPGVSGGAFLTPSVRLGRRGKPGDGAAIWTDSHGSPLLTFQQSAAGPRWRFASRFHPDWSNLPLTTAFPAWLESLLLGNPATIDPHDFRLADAVQARPSDVPLTSVIAPLSPSDSSDHNLHWVVWTLAAFLFCLERFASHRHSPLRTRSFRAPPPQPEPVSVR